MKIIQFLLGASIAIAVTGCKLAVMVPPGGVVQSTSGNYNCDGGTQGKFCTFDLTLVALPYNESFSVSAEPGYQFVKWQRANGFFCGDSTNPTCTLAISDTDSGRDLLSTFETGYLMPVFKYLGIDTDGDGVVDPNDADDDNDGLEDGMDNCPLFGPNDDGFGCPEPLPNSIIVDGKEWAQPLTFVNLSWEKVKEICPPVHGVSVCKGQLNGVDLTGWRWATTAQVRAFIKSYLNTEGGCDKLSQDLTFGIDSVYNGPIVLGWVSDNSASKYLVTASSSIIRCYHDSAAAGVEPDATGSWFYRIR